MEASIVKDLTQEFLEKLTMNIDSLEVITEGENIYYIKIKTDESSLFIGYSGRNLEDIRCLLKLLISKRLDKKIIIHLEINDYISKKDDKLFNFIEKKLDYLRRTGTEITLPYYNAYDRKKIHSFVSDLNDDTIYTKSVGEGNQRRLHLCKKSQNITIDIDGIDI